MRAWRWSVQWRVPQMALLRDKVPRVHVKKSEHKKFETFPKVSAKCFVRATFNASVAACMG